MEPPKDPARFGHPYTPYQIQVDFMNECYRAIEQGKVAVFESPTGTGKSLSIICGALRWLQDHEQRCEAQAATIEKATVSTETATGVEDWVATHAARMAQRPEVERAESWRRRQALAKASLERARGVSVNAQDLSRKSGRKHASRGAAINDDDDFCLSDDETTRWSRNQTDLALADEDDAETDDTAQIVFASRTHSQLAQFVQELRKTPYRANTRTVLLGSRKTMCVNPAVQRLQTLTRINDRCKELQQRSGTGKGAGCPFYERAGDVENNRQRLADQLLATPADMEDLVQRGRQLHSCPYYASRDASGLAQLVVAPYNLVLHREAREAVGLSLRGRVVIFDEAHNLADAVASAYAVAVTSEHLARAGAQLDAYWTRYRTVLSATNSQSVQQLRLFVRALSARLSAGGNASAHTLETPSAFLGSLATENLNLYRLHAFLRDSRLPFKLQGFALASSAATAEDSQNTADDAPPSQMSPVVHVRALLQALLDPDGDGRVLVEPGVGVRYILLNPANAFADIVAQARAVIFAGGTMAPLEDYRALLLPQVGNDRFHVFSCAHVVPADRVVVLAAGCGPTGQPLRFTFRERETEAVLDELGRALANVAAVVPDGLVVFFPSYRLLDSAFARWSATGAHRTLAERGKKRIFREPAGAGSVEGVLGAYADAIRRPTPLHSRGAILFAVVGGKMSEGINFGDQLGRAVVLVGLPFPSRASPELAERLAYMDKRRQQARPGEPTVSGKDYYLNLCMRAVNQSIGRAIRHRGDYAAILLFDERYAQPQIRARIPAWLHASMAPFSPTFGPIVARLGQFFRRLSQS